MSCLFGDKNYSKELVKFIRASMIMLAEKKRKEDFNEKRKFVKHKIISTN